MTTTKTLNLIHMEENVIAIDTDSTIIKAGDKITDTKLIYDALDIDGFIGIYKIIASQIQIGPSIPLIPVRKERYECAGSNVINNETRAFVCEFFGAGSRLKAHEYASYLNRKEGVDIKELALQAYPYNSDEGNIDQCIQDGKRYGFIEGFKAAGEFSKDDMEVFRMRLGVAIIDDIDLGYDVEMIKDKIKNGSYYESDPLEDFIKQKPDTITIQWDGDKPVVVDGYVIIAGI